MSLRRSSSVGIITILSVDYGFLVYLANTIPDDFMFKYRFPSCSTKSNGGNLETRLVTDPQNNSTDLPSVSLLISTFNP